MLFGEVISENTSEASLSSQSIDLPLLKILPVALARPVRMQRTLARSCSVLVLVAFDRVADDTLAGTGGPVRGALIHPGPGNLCSDKGQMGHPGLARDWSGI